ncbi:MAG: hypothetical protein ACRDBP_04790 [Luteolibacter sp.]
MKAYKIQALKIPDDKCNISLPRVSAVIEGLGEQEKMAVRLEGFVGETGDLPLHFARGGSAVCV